MDAVPDGVRIDPKKLKECVDAARRANQDRDPGPDDPVDLALLTASLAQIVGFPGIYNDCALQPLRMALERLGPAGFAAVLSKHQGDLLILDLAQALSQRHGNYHRRELMAFQEVVSDLYDGFLSSQDRRGLRRPEQPVPAPLVKWGRPELGPYALGADQMAVLGVRCGIVSLPGAVARADGLFAWGVLPHETAGHAVLACEPGLLGQLAEKLGTALHDDLQGEPELKVSEEDIATLVDHWSFTLDEAAADVLGVLNMGPAAAVASLILLLASCSDCKEERGRLLLTTNMLERHPVPLLRVPLMAEVLRRTRYGSPTRSDGWGYRAALLLDGEADALAGPAQVMIGDRQIAWPIAKRSAQTVASVIAMARPASLDHASLAAIQSWRDRDEWIVGQLRQVLIQGTSDQVQDLVEGGFYGAHVVAATILEALHNPQRLPELHCDMTGTLALMHDANPSWGPLGALYPSDLAPQMAGLIPRPTAFAGGIPRPRARTGGPRLTAVTSGIFGDSNSPATGTGGIPPMFQARNVHPLSTKHAQMAAQGEGRGMTGSSEWPYPVQIPANPK